jgi:hypothetical protein
VRQRVLLLRAVHGDDEDAAVAFDADMIGHAGLNAGNARRLIATRGERLRTA